MRSSQIMQQLNDPHHNATNATRLRLQHKIAERYDQILSASQAHANTTLTLLQKTLTGPDGNRYEAITDSKLLLEHLIESFTRLNFTASDRGCESSSSSWIFTATNCFNPESDASTDWHTTLLIRSCNNTTANFNYIIALSLAVCNGSLPDNRNDSTFTLLEYIPYLLFCCAFGCLLALCYVEDQPEQIELPELPELPTVLHGRTWQDQDYESSDESEDEINYDDEENSLTRYNAF